MKRTIAPLLAALVIVACGSSTSDPSDASVVVTEADAGDAAPRQAQDADATDAADQPDSAPLACGSTTCGGTDYCIVPCSGGILPPCIPAEAGVCPSGTSFGNCLGDSGPTTAGCVTNPPPPYCSPSPTCGGSQGRASGRRIDCICA